MSNSVVLVDYGVGNLLSVRWALEAVGADVIQTADSRAIATAERIVLPGVGAFAHCMAELHRYNLIDSLKDFSRSGRPMLGICVGMQMMMDASEEFGFNEGLGLIPGFVKKIRDTNANGDAHKIPHIGWNAITSQNQTRWLNTPLEGTAQKTHFYFVHSFSAAPEIAENLLATTNYGGLPITAAIQTGNTFGLQFHPEKSGPDGLAIMKKFLALDPL